MSGGGGGDLDNEYQIAGGTDGTIIGNVGDALKVSGGSGGGGGSSDPRPTPDVFYEVHFLESGGSRSMDVNGSSTPVDFRYTPGGSAVKYLERLSILGLDSGTCDYDDFWARSDLTNGLRINIKSKGVVYELANPKTNIEVQLSFPDSCNLDNTDSEWLKNRTFFHGNIWFKVPIELDAAQSDYVEARVRDDLIGLTELNMSVRVWESI